MKKCIILANGQPPKKKIFDFLSDENYKILICADGGANTAAKYDLIPDYIIGDLDSITPEVYNYFFDKCKIIQIKKQNNTDVEKCLDFAIQKKFEEVVLLGAIGDRLDHTFCNLGIVLKYFPKIKIKIIHHKSFLCAYSGKKIIKTIPNEIISLYGIDSKTHIISTGLKYPLKNINLPFGKKESTSNAAIGKEVILKVKNGKILVIRDFEIMKNYGLF